MRRSFRNKYLAMVSWTAIAFYGVDDSDRVHSVLLY